MIRQEDSHHSREQIDGYVRDALDVLEPHELTERERAALLPQLVALFAAKQIFYQQPTPMQLPTMAIPAGRRH